MPALTMPDPWPAADGVVLRPFTDADVPMLMDLATDPYLSLIGSLPPHADAQQARDFIARQADRLRTRAGWSFCVADLETGAALGTAGLWLARLDEGSATVGYSVAPRERGRGVAGRALRALLAFGWTVPGVRRIEAYVEPWNIASLRTAEAAGFAREAELPAHQEIGGRRVDMVLLATTRDPANR